MTQEPIQSNIDDVLKFTPFGAQKTAELDVQFSIDPSYGLTRQRLGWYSNNNLFDSSLFTENTGSITMETTATATDTCRLRSAYPGRYISHTLAEPGIGMQIPSEYIERGPDNLTSLTHGEISSEVVEWDDTTNTGRTGHGISFESDGTYAQIRKGDQNVEFVRQENWNVDPLDGTGPSGKVLKPENGVVYNFPFTWYGHGALILAIQDPDTANLLPLHAAKIKGDVSLDTPNLPTQVTVENQGTADPLGVNVGGMQFAAHGSGNLKDSETGRQTEVIRRTGAGFIDTEVATSGGQVQPFTQAGVPLVSVQRDSSQLSSRVALGLDFSDIYVNVDSDVYIFVFDEFDPEANLTGDNFLPPATQAAPNETRIVADTEATDYTPGTNSVLRSALFVSGEKNEADVITGDASSRVPIESAVVVTAALAVGSNNTEAQPCLFTVRESF